VTWNQISITPTNACWITGLSGRMAEIIQRTAGILKDSRLYFFSFAFHESDVHRLIIYPTIFPAFKSSIVKKSKNGVKFRFGGVKKKLNNYCLDPTPSKGYNSSATSYDRRIAEDMYLSY